MAIIQFGYHLRMAEDVAPNRIRELREALGMTQTELAKRANVTPSALNKIEMGTRGLDQQWMRRLAQPLGCTPADLLPNEDHPYRLNDEERAIVRRLRTARPDLRAQAVAVFDALFRPRLAA